MRIANFEIRNFKGVAFARATNLHDENVVTISGKNGTGKSHVLEALAAAWNVHHLLGHSAGSWGAFVSVSYEVVLTDDEWDVVEEWMAQRGDGPPIRTQALKVTITAPKGNLHEGGVMQPQIMTENPVMHHLLDPSFKRLHRFALIDFVPAKRLLQGGQDASVNLSMLALKEVDQQRESLLGDVLEFGNALQLPTAASYLMTLDYQDHLATRAGTSLGQFAQIADTFYGATGKRIPKPRYAAETGGAIDVEIGHGISHDISGLSTGEQEMIAMMYSVKRLSATGGVMLMDEPEQHLHPSLQATLFDTMKDLSASSQVFVVTHSVNLISAANPSGLIEVDAVEGPHKNQLMRLKEHPEKVELVAKLGLAAGDYFQNDLFLVVEGKTDAKWLAELFPLQLGRSHIIVAGSSKQVLEAHRMLESLSPGVPWLCVVDRDLRSDAEVLQLESAFDNLFVWGRRAIENMCVEAGLVRKAMKHVGMDYSVEEIEDLLTNIAIRMKEEVVSVAVHTALRRKVPPLPQPDEGDKFAKAVASYRNNAIVNEERAAKFFETLHEVREEIEVRWDAEWLCLVNPHNFLGALHAQLGGYENDSALMSALISVAREEDTMPAGLEAFKLRLTRLLQTEQS